MSKFKEGDKVEVFDNAFTNKNWVGVQGIVQTVLGYGYHVTLTETAKTGKKVGYVAYLTGSNLKLVEEVKRELKVGDKVLVDADKPEATWHNTEGVITELRYASTHRVKVTKAGPHNADLVGLGKEYTLSNLTLLPEFTFKDIQVGDTVRRTRKYEDGSTEVYEGVITKKTAYYAENDNLTVAYSSDDTREDGSVTLELVNRPEPEPEPVKEAWETAKAGDRLVVKGEGGTRILTKQENGEWETLIVTDGGSHTGFSRTDSALKVQLGRKDFNADGNHKFYPAS